MRKERSSIIMEQFQRKGEWNLSRKNAIDCFLFDGASNVQTAGAILCAKHPWAKCFYGREHVLSLFFRNVSKSNPNRLISVFCFFSLYFSNLLLLVVKYCKLYGVFMSGSSHGIYVQFIVQANSFNVWINGFTLRCLVTNYLVCPLENLRTHLRS